MQPSRRQLDVCFHDDLAFQVSSLRKHAEIRGKQHDNVRPVDKNCQRQAQGTVVWQAWAIILSRNCPFFGPFDNLFVIMLFAKCLLDERLSLHTNCLILFDVKLGAIDIKNHIIVGMVLTQDLLNSTILLSNLLTPKS